MSKFLVTGGAGFIGSHITDRLVRLGHKVKVLDNFTSGTKRNLSNALGKIELIEGDVRDIALLRRVVKNVDFVSHQAALRSVPKSVDNPLEFNEVNITGTLNVLIASCQAHVKRVVYASSSSIYGQTNKLPEKENAPPLLISPYAATKLAGEYYCRIFSKTYGLSTVSLRYFNVFGPRQSLESEYAVVVPKFITCIWNNESPPIHGSGRQSRDFTYIDNVVNANLSAFKSRKIKGGEVFNIASGRSYTVLGLVESLNKIMHKNIKPKFIAPRPGDVLHTLADISYAAKCLGFRPKIDFMTGLKRTVEWFKENKGF